MLKKRALFFASGGIGYGLLEILWRGRTHWSMVLAGGICLNMFSRVAETFRNRSLVCKAAICSAGVTGVELVFGIVFNKLLKKNVWDYSDMPFNFCGQICLLYTVLWGVLGFLLIPLVERINRRF